MRTRPRTRNESHGGRTPMLDVRQVRLRHTRERRERRAFSLIETMIVSSIIMVLAAIAVPQLLPEVQKAHLDGAAEATAAFLARARNEAMLSKRCVRVWVDSTNPRRIVSEK